MMPLRVFRALSSSDKDIPEDSPLGCLLSHWKEGKLGRELRKRELIDYCNKVWPEYETGGMQWPWNGTINPEILTPMMRYLRENEKWEEIPYLDLFYQLIGKKDWQRKCGMMVLETEPEECMGCKGRRVRFSEPEEDVSLLVSPSDPVNLPLPDSDSSEEESDSEKGERERSRTPEPRERGREQSRTPLSQRTRRGRLDRGKSASRAHLMAPLREAVGPTGDRVRVKVPFSPNDLIIWKQSAGAYRENPEKVARVVKMVIKTQNPDWNDLQVLLDLIMDSTEKEMVFKAMSNRARDMIQLQAPALQGIGNVNEIVPREDPEWNPNSAEEYHRLQVYQELLVEGIQRGIPKTLNWSKLYAVRQDKAESPSAFLERLKEIARRYTDLDVESEAGKLQMALIFMRQSQGDIRRKLQKLEGNDTRDLEKMLEVAWKVYNNREKEAVKKQQASMLAVLQQASQMNVRGRGRGRGRGNGGMGRGGFGGFVNQNVGNQMMGRGRGKLGPNQCARCFAEGHWKNECPLNLGMRTPMNNFPGGNPMNQRMNANDGLNPFAPGPQGVAQAFMMGSYQNQS